VNEVALNLQPDKIIQLNNRLYAAKRGRRPRSGVGV
jgi:hypothetical protein